MALYDRADECVQPLFPPSLQIFYDDINIHLNLFPSFDLVSVPAHDPLASCCAQEHHEFRIEDASLFVGEHCRQKRALRNHTIHVVGDLFEGNHVNVHLANTLSFRT